VTFRQLWRRFILGAPPDDIPDYPHPELGLLHWDSGSGYWTLSAPTANGSVRVSPWGHHQRGPDPVAVQLLLPLLPRLDSAIREASTYLAAELARSSRQAVEPTAVCLDGLSVYAGKHPSLELDYSWDGQPNWVLRVHWENGRPTSWGHDS
jgi:hypothetical protein